MAKYTIDQLVSIVETLCRSITFTDGNKIINIDINILKNNIFLSSELKINFSEDNPKYVSIVVVKYVLNNIANITKGLEKINDKISDYHATILNCIFFSIDNDEFFYVGKDRSKLLEFIIHSFGSSIIFQKLEFINLVAMIKLLVDSCKICDTYDGNQKIMHNITLENRIMLPSLTSVISNLLFINFYEYAEDILVPLINILANIIIINNQQNIINVLGKRCNEYILRTHFKKKIFVSDFLTKYDLFIFKSLFGNSRYIYL